MLVALLEEVYSKRKAVATQDYVDDLAQQMEHGQLLQPSMRVHACAAALLVAEGFEKRGLRVSSKTTVGASNKTLIMTVAKLRERRPEAECCKHGEESENAEKACSVEHNGQDALVSLTM